jgi:phosphate transport system permease protein
MSIATLERPSPSAESGKPTPRALNRRRPRQFTVTDALVLVGSALSAICFVWIVFYQLTLLAGAPGFVICALLSFLVIYYLANRSLFGHVAAVNRVIGAIVTAAAAIVTIALGLVVAFLTSRGYHLISWHFLTHDQSGVTQTAPATAGGISHAIIGTLEQVGIAVLIGAPAGIITAIFINEVGGRITSLVRTVVTAMSALPTIVAGLFIYVIYISATHHGFSGFAGSLALSIMLLPNVTRTTEEVLKVVHGSLREASMALGAPQWRTVWSVVLPTARTGIVTAVLLGIARVVGETAPLIVTIFGNTLTESNPFHAQEALPLFIWQSYGQPHQADVERAFAAGLVLVGLVLILFVLARLIASIKPGVTNRMITRLRRSPLEAS